MALIHDSSLTSLSISSMMGKAQRALTSFFAPAEHSPEYDLLSGPMRDARLAPRVPMSNADIDVGLLTQLSSIGLQRAKQVTDQSHPELMQAWKAMAKRAGLQHPPQLIIAESPSLNAITVNKEEVTITTGLLRILDLRETVAVLGHELGHVQSDHVTPRIRAHHLTTAVGMVLGNEFGRHGGAHRALGALGSKMPIFDKIKNLFYGAHYARQQSSTLGSLIYMSVGAGVGQLIGRQLTVRPTELDADTKGAAVSGDPQGLALALGQLQQHSPRKGLLSTLAQIQSGYPSTESRIANLQRLAAQQAETPVMDQVNLQAAPAVTPTANQPTMAVSSIVGKERVSAPASPALA